MFLRALVVLRRTDCAGNEWISPESSRMAEGKLVKIRLAIVLKLS